MGTFSLPQVGHSNSNICRGSNYSDSGGSTLGMISVPMWIPQLIMPIGGFLMLVHGMAHLATTARNIAGRVNLSAAPSDEPVANNI